MTQACCCQKVVHHTPPRAVFLGACKQTCFIARYPAIEDDAIQNKIGKPTGDERQPDSPGRSYSDADARVVQMSACDLQASCEHKTRPSVTALYKACEIRSLVHRFVVLRLLDLQSSLHMCQAEEGQKAVARRAGASRCSRGKIVFFA